jgi:hypothetical protein
MHMFCVHCGAENPDIGSFCRKCGKALVKDEFGVHTPAVTQTVQSEDVVQFPGSTSSTAGVIDMNSADTQAVQSEQGVRPLGGVSAKVTWLYVGLSLELTCAVLILTVVVVAFTAQLIAGTLETVQDAVVKGIIPILIAAFAAKRTWAAILKREPEQLPRFKTFHQRVLVIAICTMAICLILAVFVGVRQGNKAVKNQSLSRLISQWESTNQESAAFTKKLAAIRGKSVKTFDEYYQQCLALEKILPEDRDLLNRRDKLLEEFALETKDDPPYVLVVSRTRPIYAKDREFLELLEKETGLAKDLMQLPPARRAGYYHDKIEPLEARIRQLAAEQTMMMQQAKSKNAQ